ncbi:hypothetical protein KSP40_PGU010730 [Platanthera guangdongensis]|uniref:tryptophan--tRNA ligase n=1 Tax=Platanthera guangdongensis TaxID=2320717 RepID=A0ABR2N3E9_9ASPA
MLGSARPFKIICVIQWNRDNLQGAGVTMRPLRVTRLRLDHSRRRYRRIMITHIDKVGSQITRGRGLRSHSSVASVPPDGRISGSRTKAVVCGLQKTGGINLGNKIGALEGKISLRNLLVTFCLIHTALSFQVHNITLPYDAPQLSETTRNTAAIYLACGVDTSKASVFVQSHVHAHVELMWLLSSDTPTGWLNRMIQFKEKSHLAGNENVGAALLTYPVLMAADILLYQSDFVPVGDDQMQHLELTRELAEKINNLYGGRKWKKLGGKGGTLFKVPEALIQPTGARVMSLTDGLSKMSKSDPSDMSRINLLDPKDVSANKVFECSPDHLLSLHADQVENMECVILLRVWLLTSGVIKKEIKEWCAERASGQFQVLKADFRARHLRPFSERRREISSKRRRLPGKCGDRADVGVQKLRVRHRYHQIRMHPSDIKDVFFITGDGCYNYKMISFGLNNAGATYQRMMDQVFREQKGRNLEVYVDDLIFKSRDVDSHLQDLEETFGTLQKYKMRLNPL